MGHVDGVGRLRRVEARDNAWDLEISVLPDILRLVIPRGSVTVQGVSLTVTERTPESFRVSIIPHTWKATTLSQVSIGCGVNVECDVVVRYVQGLLEPLATGTSPGITPEFLKAHGFVA